MVRWPKCPTRNESHRNHSDVRWNASPQTPKLNGVSGTRQNRVNPPDVTGSRGCVLCFFLLTEPSLFTKHPGLYSHFAFPLRRLPLSSAGALALFGYLESRRRRTPRDGVDSDLTGLRRQLSSGLAT